MPSFFSAAEIAPLCSETERLIEAARGKAESDAVHDLEAPHQPDGEPRVRRIKDPVQQFDVYREFSRNEKLLSVVRVLIGDNVRFHNSKINIKAAGFGAAVEWHQDWAFYPHTNDAVLAVGIALQDLTEDNAFKQWIIINSIYDASQTDVENENFNRMLYYLFDKSKGNIARLVNNYDINIKLNSAGQLEDMNLVVLETETFEEDNNE